MGEEWRLLERATDMAALCAAFGLPHPIDPEGDYVAESLAMLELGLCETAIVREPRFTHRSTRKTARDAELERDTIHGAPTWRPTLDDETGTRAIILPVCAPNVTENLTLSLAILNADDFAAHIADLVAIPLDGGRPLSRSGHTLAIGTFRAEEGKLVLRGSGKAWLDAYLALARETAADTPAHLVERLHTPFPAPDYGATLVIEPLALDWRVTSAGCVIPHDAMQVVCPDSRALAQKIDELMRRRERVRPLPKVLGPRSGVAA